MALGRELQKLVTENVFRISAVVFLAFACGCQQKETVGVHGQEVPLLSLAESRTVVTNDLQLISPVSDAEVASILSELARVPDISLELLSLRVERTAIPIQAKVLSKKGDVVLFIRKDDGKWAVQNVSRVLPVPQSLKPQTPLTVTSTTEPPRALTNLHDRPVDWINQLAITDAIRRNPESRRMWEETRGTIDLGVVEQKDIKEIWTLMSQIEGFAPSSFGGSVVRFGNFTEVVYAGTRSNRSYNLYFVRFPGRKWILAEAKSP